MLLGGGHSCGVLSAPGPPLLFDRWKIERWKLKKMAVEPKGGSCQAATAVSKGMVEISSPCFLAFENGGLMLLSAVACVLLKLINRTETRPTFLGFFVQSGIRQANKCIVTSSKAGNDESKMSERLKNHLEFLSTVSEMYTMCEHLRDEHANVTCPREDEGIATATGTTVAPREVPKFTRPPRPEMPQHPKNQAGKPVGGPAKLPVSQWPSPRRKN